MPLQSTSVNRGAKRLQFFAGTDRPPPTAPLLISYYVGCAYYSWHASTHGFLQKMATWHIRQSLQMAT
jgi:hypothetical protein